MIEQVESLGPKLERRPLTEGQPEGPMKREIEVVPARTGEHIPPLVPEGVLRRRDEARRVVPTSDRVIREIAVANTIGPRVRARVRVVERQGHGEREPALASINLAQLPS